MAYIHDFAVTEYGLSTIASLVCNMPDHQAGDILLHMSSKDGAVAINATSGWTAIQDGVTAGAAYRCEWKLAASAAETLTLVTGTAENFTAVVLCIRGANTSTPVHISAESGADDSAMPFVGPSTTTSNANCLILHGWFTDSGLSPTAYAPLVNVYAGDNGANSAGVAYTYKRAGGAVAAASWFGRANDDGRGVVIAINDDGTDDYVPGYSDAAVSSGQVLRPAVGLATTFSDSWPAALTVARLGDDFDSAYRYNAPSTYTNILTALNDATAADVTAPTAVGDMLYFGGAEKFQAVLVTVSTAGVAGALAWEYWTGAAWSATGVTGSNLTATGDVLVTLNVPAVAAMSQTAVNSATRYWLRARITTLYTTAIVLSQGRKDGRTATYVAATASADNGTNPYTDGAANAGSSTATTCAGFQWNFGAALDMDTGIVAGTFRAALRRDLDIDPSFPMPVAGPGGLQVTFYDASNNYLSYIVHARGSLSADPDARNVWAIDWNGAAQPWAARGTLNKSAVTYSLFSSLGQSGAVAVVWSMLSLVTRIGIAGGSADIPLDFSDVRQVANNCIGMYPFVQAAGAAYTVFAPLQFGGGDKLCLAVDKTTIQFPAVYDGQRYFAWNAADNVAGVKFYPQSGDVVKFTNCLFTGPSPYRWEFDASMAASGWTMDFTGTTVVGATVTLRASSDLSGMVFNACPSFAQNGASLSDCGFVDTKVSCSSPADAALISDCSFSSSGAGHAIEIGGTAANVTLDGDAFAGYAASNGSTGNEAIFVNIASGSMTISITGGGSTPSIRTAGATVTVQNNVTVTLTGLANPSEVRVFNAGSTSERGGTGAENVTSGSHAFTLPASTAVDISILSLAYQNQRILNYSTAADAVVPVSQALDRQYLNP